MGRKFGVELEYTTRNVGFNDMKRILRRSVADHNSEKRVLDTETFRAWTIKSEHCGLEITSPAIESSARSMNLIKNVVDGIRRQTRGIGSVVNRDCGLHVHIDIGDFTTEQIRNLCRVFYNFEGILFQILPPSRSDNGYVHHLTEHGPSWIDNFDPDIYDECQENSDFMFDHSNAVNFERFLERGTVEFRYAAGTVRGVKVMGWVRLLLTLVEIAKNNPDIPINRSESLEDLKDFINDHATDCSWLENQKERCCRWFSRRREAIVERRRRQDQRR